MNNSTKTSYESNLYISEKQPVIHLDPIFVYPDGVEEKIEKIRGNIIETMPKEKSFISKYGSEIAGTLFATETRIKLEGYNMEITLWQQLKIKHQAYTININSIISNRIL